MTSTSEQVMDLEASLLQIHYTLTQFNHQLQHLQQTVTLLNQTQQQEFNRLSTLLQQLLIQMPPTSRPSPEALQTILRQQEQRLQERLQQIQRQSPLT